MYLTPQPETGAFRMGRSCRTVPPYWNRVQYPSPSYLGAITADAATEQVFPASKVRSGAGHNQSLRDQILASANAGQLLNAQGGPDYVPGTGQCAGASMLKPALLSTASGFSLKFAPMAFAAGPIVGGIVVAVGALTAVFGAIFGHHAQAVKKEQSVLCAAVPAANQSVQLINEAVTSGQATPQQGIDALNSVLDGFGQQVAAIRHGADPTSSGECNAACAEYSKLKAIVLYIASQYQDMITAPSASGNPVTAATDALTNALGPVLSPVTGAITSAASATGIPSWVLLTGGGLLLWKLFG